MHRALLVPVAALALSPMATARTQHVPGCRKPVGYSARVASVCRHAGRHYWHRTHRFQFGSFELCVANQEAGEPGSTSFATINWHYDADYEGAYNWVNSTWLAEGGGRYAPHAYEASPEAQTLIFRAHANSQDWPRSVPACGG